MGNSILKMIFNTRNARAILHRLINVSVTGVASNGESLNLSSISLTMTFPPLGNYSAIIASGVLQVTLIFVLSTILHVTANARTPGVNVDKT